MECILIGLRAYFIQHMGSFNYGKIRTMGAVLVAISIPIFTAQLEKSREAVDEANIRAAYAEAQTLAMQKLLLNYLPMMLLLRHGLLLLSKQKINGNLLLRLKR